MAAAEEKKPQGLVCPRCGCRHFLTTHTRPVRGQIVRYKRCRHCDYRIKTYESPRRPCQM